MTDGELFVGLSLTIGLPLLAGALTLIWASLASAALVGGLVLFVCMVIFLTCMDTGG